MKFLLDESDLFASNFEDNISTQVFAGPFTSGKKKKSIPGLQHVRHVKDGRVFAGVQVRRQHAEARVLHRHGVSSERNHLAAMLDVEVVESGPFEGL